MTEGISCLTDPVIIGGKAYAPIPFGTGAPAQAPLRAGGVPRLRDAVGRGASPGLLHGALPGLPRPGARLRLPVRVRLRLREREDRALHLTRAAAGRLALGA